MIVGSIKSYVSFAKRALSKRPHSAKETYDFKEPTHRSHPIVFVAVCCSVLQSCPSTGEIRLQIFGSPDFTVSQYTLLSDGDSAYPVKTFSGFHVSEFGDSRENVLDVYRDSRAKLLEILTVVIFVHSDFFRLLRLWTSQ